MDIWYSRNMALLLKTVTDWRRVDIFLQGCDENLNVISVLRVL